MLGTLSFPLLPVQLWQGVLLPVRVTSIDQIEVFLRLLLLAVNWNDAAMCSLFISYLINRIINAELQYSRQFNYVQTNKFLLV